MNRFTSSNRRQVSWRKKILLGECELEMWRKVVKFYPIFNFPFFFNLILFLQERNQFPNSKLEVVVDKGFVLNPLQSV